ncbi:prolyl oligopeptidase family serine peptidase [Rhodopirellula sp. MGV]|uniref:prolyl oligopeptidase family serine peptidase n=1 Tax=Rhodopirellula sp. MGV TaxID=2023130 RepID=UPI001304365B|nr:prolyl oligopeptidase family serine peptidase [Rhodopirellula sp. MGV]
MPIAIVACSGRCCVSQDAVESRTINQRIIPRWIDDTHFSFTEELPTGERVTRQVDCESGEIETVSSEDGGRRDALSGGPLPVSETSATDSELTFVNEADESVELYWLDQRGFPTSYGDLAPGKSKTQHTFSGHAWMVRSSEGPGGERKFYGSVVAGARPLVAKISKTFDTPESLTPRSRRRFRARTAPGGSPDESMRFTVEQQDSDGERSATLRVWNVEASRDSAKDLLTVNGADLVDVSWSPDGTLLAGWKLVRHEPAMVTMVESSPKEGGRAVVRQHAYRLPGDPYDDYELFVIDIDKGEALPCELPVVDFGRPRVRWLGDHQITFEKVDRGHQRFRLFVFDPLTGETRTPIDESTETFIWTMHGPNVPLVSYFGESDEVIYSSEASGFRHLYLVNLSDKDSAFHFDPQSSYDAIEPLAITKGEWLVRKIESIDEDARSIDLMVGGFYQDQDPYLQHLVRATLDGESLVPLTDANGDQSFEFSPNKDYLVTTSSRIDSPPLHQLRKTEDGSLVCDLVQAQRVGDDSNWRSAERFHTKGRDGETEIWGNIYFPEGFDPQATKRYPIIEAIYAGPHDSHVPTRYLHGARHQDLTSLGFVVVQIDGMGTANRSKAFHDVCWHNLKDAGFPDRIQWIKDAAEKYPALDASRVGIFGTSAGGQNACGALVFHGDFYKSAYASCGCHDNRMDKASWNEQWMGYPVGPHYSASSNIDNASQLQGNLFLVVGELDFNVPPESTYRLADALIKADKDFDYLVVPSMGHSDGGRYGKRRMRDFFVETLQPQAD